MEGQGRLGLSIITILVIAANFVDKNRASTDSSTCSRSGLMIQDATTCDFVASLRQSMNATQQVALLIEEYLNIANMEMAQITDDLCCDGRKTLITKVPKPKSDVDSVNPELPTSCADIKKKLPLSKNGIYPIRPENVTDSINVYCDMDSTTGGWTVIQKRREMAGGQENFYRNWTDYKQGFGDLNGEFWLGNDIIHALTSQDKTMLRFDMEDFDGASRYAHYTTFLVAPEADIYKLKVAGYKGDAGDDFTFHNGQPFHTFDHDTTKRKCTHLYKGGWWYKDCHEVNANGVYLRAAYKGIGEGIECRGFRGHYYSLRKMEMKLRPADF